MAATDPGAFVLVTDTDLAELDPIVDRIGPRAKEALMTTAERLEAKGRAEGEAEGRAETLLDLLGIKFGRLPHQTVERVRAGDIDQLKTWTLRILNATQLDDIFAH